MDARGRLAESVTLLGKLLAAVARALPARPARKAPARRQVAAFVPPPRLPRALQRWVPGLGKSRLGVSGLWVSWLFARHIPRGAGTAATAFLLMGSVIFGVVKGGHSEDVLAELRGWRDDAAKTAGFRIASIAMSGQTQVSREEILATAGVTARTSLLFLDADQARLKLLTNPWIEEAAVLKLFPGQLQIIVKERTAYALWQQEGRVSVIATDGTVLEPYVSSRFVTLPMIVGDGADAAAKPFFATLHRYPDIAAQVSASILVAQRRWNLKLKSGIDVRLPEAGMDGALKTLVALDHDKKLLSRDIAAVDLRLPDRVTVQLSDEAAKAREDALLKEKKARKKAGAA